MHPLGNWVRRTMITPNAQHVYPNTQKKIGSHLKVECQICDKSGIFRRFRDVLRGFPEFVNGESYHPETSLNRFLSPLNQYLDVRNVKIG